MTAVVRARFDFSRDRFAFSNELSRGGGRRFPKRCYAMARATMQFWRHAEFRADRPPPDREELARRVAEVASRRADRPARRRVVFDGFASLHELSKREPELVRDGIGRPWEAYLRWGNLPVLFVPPTRARQERWYRALRLELERGRPVAVWLYTYPHMFMTHSVVAFSVEPGEEDTSLFRVYDPNYRTFPKRLVFDRADRRFRYQRTYFFRGGPMALAPIWPRALGAPEEAPAQRVEARGSTIS